jgi:hypothetical protein
MDDIESRLLDIKELKDRHKQAREDMFSAELNYLAAKDAVDDAVFVARQHGASINSIAKALGVMDTRTAKNAIKRGAQKASENGVQF